VIAVAALLSGRGVTVAPHVATTLQLRQFVFLARTIPVGKEAVEADGEMAGAEMPDLFVRPLVSLARKPPATRRDRLRAAAVAVAFDARELVPLFAGPLAASDPLAGILVRWALDPNPAVTHSELNAVRTSDLDAHLKDQVILAMAETSGMKSAADAARQSADERWSKMVTLGGFLGALMLVVLVAGSVLWFRTRRLPAGQPPAGELSLAEALPMVRVFVYFMAVFLTVSLLAPPLMSSSGGLPAPSIMVLNYVITGCIGLWLIKAFGRQPGDGSWADEVGLSRSFKRARAILSAKWAVGAYCMIWPAMLGASILSSGLFGEGGGVFESPLAVFLVTETDTSTTLLMLLSVAVLAPLFEETLFRGYLYGRLRRYMKPVPAAALSGLVFGAAHMSLTNFLPLAAIGFTLALAYERTRDLATPMLAHGAWNLVEAMMLITVFR